MTIFESWHADKAFHQRLELSLLVGLGRVLAVCLSFYLSLRLVDLMRRHALHLLLQPRPETYLFVLEIALLTIPMLLLFRRSVHTNRTALYFCSVLTLLGFVANRMNVAITGMLSASDGNYFPKWTEISITLAILGCGFLAFALAVKYLPIFPNGHPYPAPTQRNTAATPPSIPELSHVGP
jgi:Ni/Fe-hydrogenase subunit HybB-like protein